ncbi:hypothetical protein ITG08_20465 [Vibrio cyclitrophicus]|uniref:hypothetical protein n=1 Tax=Vibrio cyclitrophicus TaxID=47951 RepID=UPI00205CE4DE|nr:hypothetical protein [Vibrio cyclitrophicus]UPR26985.1 hypothetical protein ITG08_20465 [Vibrio cyclitrophicus]
MYSFVQSSSQQQSSSTISSQVDKLMDVVDKIDLSKQSLSDTLSHLNSVSEKIDHTIEQHDEVKKEVKVLSGRFKHFVESSSKYVHEANDNSDEPLHARPLSSGYNGIASMCIFLYFIEKHNFTIDNGVDEFILPVFRQLSDDAGDDEKFKDYQDGALMVAYQMLYSFGCLKVSAKSGHIELSGEFRSECEDFIEYSEEHKEDDYLSSIIKGCISFSKS